MLRESVSLFLTKRNRAYGCDLVTDPGERVEQDGKRVAYLR